MQEMRLIDAYALDKDVSGRCAYNFDVDIARALIANAPEIPAVPLEVHERMKRELNTEIERFKKIETTINTFWSELRKIIIAKGKETPTLEELLEHIEQLKAEAIKELLDKIEKQAILNEDDVYWVELDDIYNLVREMVGDTE